MDGDGMQRQELGLDPTDMLDNGSHLQDLTYDGVRALLQQSQQDIQAQIQTNIRDISEMRLGTVRSLARSTSTTTGPFGLDHSEGEAPGWFVPSSCLPREPECDIDDETGLPRPPWPSSEHTGGEKRKRGQEVCNEGGGLHCPERYFDIDKPVEESERPSSRRRLTFSTCGTGGGAEDCAAAMREWGPDSEEPDYLSGEEAENWSPPGYVHWLESDNVDARYARANPDWADECWEDLTRKGPPTPSPFH